MNEVTEVDCRRSRNPCRKGVNVRPIALAYPAGAAKLCDRAGDILAGRLAGSPRVVRGHRVG